MNSEPAGNYRFESLAGRRPCPSLAYLVGLVDSVDHRMSDPEVASRILVWLYEVEEQSPDASYLLSRQNEFFARYFSGGYFPQTPCMLTKKWSPIYAMLERGMTPFVLNRSGRVSLTATGIWDVSSLDATEAAQSGENFEWLFWTTLNEVLNRAKRRAMRVSVIASPGWDYKSAVDSLPRWTQEDIDKADRVLWRRTPEDATPAVKA
jgi:hypothetical protein